jgi:hypothetical protein
LDVENITSYLKSSNKDKAYLRFEFYYTDKSHEYACNSYLDSCDFEWYKTFKVVELKTENTIEFSNDEPSNIVMHHVEERFRNLIASDLTILNNKILKKWNGEFEEKPNFDLYYFKNYLDCFKELKGFIDSLKFLVLFDDTSNSATFTTSNQETNAITYSSVIENLTERFGKNFENINTDQKKILKLFFKLTSEDNVELEKVVCDFYNMIKYLKNKFCDECRELDIQCLRKNKAYSKPIVINDYKCRIVRGIELYFMEYSETGEIKAYDSEDKEIELEKGVDYFKSSRSNIFIPFENVLEKNIKKIEVFSENDEFLRRFWVLDDLKIKEDDLNTKTCVREIMDESVLN